MVIALESERGTGKDFGLAANRRDGTYSLAGRPSYRSPLFSELPDHLRRAVLYKVNCDSHEQEAVKQKWN